MLQQMRKYTSSWVAAVILGVPLVISFVVWGIADIFRGSTDTSVATVGGNKIPMEIYQREYRNATREATLKGTLKPALARAYGQQALDALVGRAAVDIYTQRYGLTVSDDWVSARIRAVPLFAGPLGDFDRRKFLEFANQLGFTEDQFIQAMREDATRNQHRPAAFARLCPGHFRFRQRASFRTISRGAGERGGRGSHAQRRRARRLCEAARRALQHAGISRRHFRLADAAGRDEPGARQRRPAEAAIRSAESKVPGSGAARSPAAGVPQRGRA